VPAAAATPEESEDLTGRDLLLLDSPGRPLNPEHSAFDAEDLKETAYVIVRKRVKASVSLDNGRRGEDVNVRAGTLGRIEKRAGSRSEPLWAVELIPDSAPAPFWQTFAAELRHARPAPNRVILASSEIVEINHFFDQYRVEMTHFGDVIVRTERAPGTLDLPRIFAPAALPLEENIAQARAAGALDAIPKALQAMRLEPRQNSNEFLILEESGESPRADLRHRQCFVEPVAAGGRLTAVHADLKIFQPANAQVTADYYAIDLEMSLRDESGAAPARVVCRFPLDPIGLPLVERARQILSRRFAIGSRP
jgi:hypothetical protein